MDSLKTMTYHVSGRIAHITLNRLERGNGITFDMPFELAQCVERANLDPRVHVMVLSGNGSGFCGGYDLVQSAEGRFEGETALPDALKGSPLDPQVVAANHDPAQVWDPMTDYALMSRFAKGFMSLFYNDKPVVCKVHGYCVAGSTDMASPAIPAKAMPSNSGPPKPVFARRCRSAIPRSGIMDCLRLRVKYIQ